MKVDLLDPKTALAQMVEAAERGEEVLIARDGVAVAQLVPVVDWISNIGFLEGIVPPVPDSLLFAMSDEESAELFNLER